MARSRRKNGGPTRGRYKLKKLGKGYAAHRRPRGAAKPIVRKSDVEAGTESATKGDAKAKPAGASRA